MPIVSGKLKVSLVNLWVSESNTPHFGLISLAAFIRREFSNIEVSIIEGVNPLNEIINQNADIIGLTADTIIFTKTVQLAKEIKKRSKAALIIGGVHITAMPESLDSVFDVGVLGEGEITFSELLKIFLEHGRFPKQGLRSIKGVVFYDENEIVKVGRRELKKNIDDLPYPARDLTPMKEKYLKNQINLFGIKRIVSIMTSRGCPYQCIFCGSPVQWGTVRFHTPTYVIGEIKFLLENYNIDGIMFWDDLFIAPKKKLIEFVELIKKEGLDKKLIFFGYARANLIDEEVCQLLKSIRVKRLIFGFESGSKRVLSYLKGHSVTIADNQRAARLCRKYGITTSSGFITGIPGESLEELKETYEFIRDNPLDNTHIYILTPYPGTEIWETAKSMGLVSAHMDFGRLFCQLQGLSFFDFFKKNKQGFINGRIFLNPDYESNDDYISLIFKMQKLAYLRNFIFYLKMLCFDPGIIIRIIELNIKNIYLKTINLVRNHLCLAKTF